MADELGYDPSKIETIVEYAQHLVGSTLRDNISAKEIAAPKRRRGSWGNAVEEYYFKYDLNGDSNPDFSEVGVELKTTPMRKGRDGSLVSKERLVLTMVNYMNVVGEDFEHSHLLEKVKEILLISYLWEEKKDPLDYEVILAELWHIPREDLPQIKRDWETVVDKVRRGLAHEISGSDTLYLEACTKAADSTVRTRQPFSDVPAKPRAWALKASYMTAVQNKLLQKTASISRGEGERDLDLFTLVHARFEPYFGLTETELAESFGLGHPKHLCALITNRILGIADDEKIDEFEKAGIKPKTIRLKASGRPKEAMSFPAFDYFEVADLPFEESAFYEYLQQRYLFVVYREDANGEYRLADICFWQMPDDDLDEAQRCYEQMQANIREGHADVSVASTENRCCHVRPHGRDSRDTAPTPHNGEVVKKSFWLNQSYLQEEIAASIQ